MPDAPKPRPGDHISTFAKEMVRHAIRQLAPVSAMFNDVILTAHPGTDPADIEAFYDQECQRQREAYLASDAGRREAAHRREEAVRRQAIHDDLVAGLASLLWADDIAVLRWWDTLAEAVDYVGVTVDRHTILSAFKLRGFIANANTGEDYNPHDRDNEFRYLVGQGLDGIERHSCPHPIIGDFIAKFIAKWGSA